ncbi:MAG TPA: hypothetical protein VNK43_12555 [Gemmatimonadales bacterium]|nr:hypothetical protein [Gemmatimonadales bacterium]
MARFQARLKPEHRLRYRGINPLSWYDVVPLFPGVTQRMCTLDGERLARLKVGRDYVTVHARHFEIRPKPAAPAEDRQIPA